MAYTEEQVRALIVRALHTAQDMTFEAMPMDDDILSIAWQHAPAEAIADQVLAEQAEKEWAR